MTYSELYELKDDLIANYDVEYIIEYLDKKLSTLSGESVYTNFGNTDTPIRQELRSQMELIVRSISGEYYSELMELEAELVGTDLILLSAHIDCSKMCRNDQGTVVSISGGTPGYKSKRDAIMDGFYHYGNYGNCRHCESPYISGFTQIPNSWGTWSETEMEEAYNEQQIKRYNERMIRKYKKEGKDKLVKIWEAKPHDKYRIF